MGAKINKLQEIFNKEIDLKNKMSNSEYSQLKVLLKEACPAKNQTRFIQNHGKKIALFVSEWFKREYSGRDTGGDAFSEIGLDSNKAQKICGCFCTQRMS